MLNKTEQTYAKMVSGFDSSKIKKTPIGMKAQQDEIKRLILRGHSLTYVACKLKFHATTLSKFCINTWGTYYREDWNLTPSRNQNRRK